MKKQLLCTSAIALGIAAAPAAAQEWNLDWGGYMNQHVAFGDISDNLAVFGVGGQDWEGDGLDLHQTSEIIFTPNVTLDNGLTFGINIQLEGENVGARVDETYMSISSDTFGRLDLGAENSAGYKSMVGAPSVTSMYINSPSTSAFIPFTGYDAALSVAAGTAVNIVTLPFRQAGISSFTEVGGNNDVQRITYYTPDFNGLTVGVSYAPQGAVNAASSYSINKNAVLSDIFDIGVNYSNSFGSTDITLAARWGTGETPSLAAGASDFETWGVGFQVGFNNITIGGSWAENDNDETLVTTAVGLGDSEGWSFGVTYDAAGPWAFEALTYQSETDLVAGGVPTTFKVDREAYKIGASRTLGPGVDWDIYLVHETRDTAALPGTEIEGTLLGTAINLSF
ncbi:porin [Roseovarius sp.]|mgnify:CR=1 FL=1|uniref:porin n=1 Tax=Roseovarius sp. TaxID=1486281 RepID=UPI002630CAC0|nr:porin [Roseovarius sp.]MDM8165243.1 porin [Roseovarius sp.]